MIRLLAMGPSDEIAVSAAILGAGLTILGIVIAVASLWGILSIRAHAKDTAEKVAADKVMELLSKESDFSRKLKEEVRIRIEAESDRLYQDISMSAAFSVRTKLPDEAPIAEEYPRGENA